MDIWQKVFGNIKSSMVIGAMPDVHTIEKMFISEMALLESELHRMSQSELEVIKKIQIETEKFVNAREGAMAISQEKIRMFIKFNHEYISLIDNQIKIKNLALKPR